MRWEIPNHVEKICKDKFQVLAKEKIKIPSRSAKIIYTKVNVELTSGIIFVTANNEVNEKLNCFQNNNIIIDKGYINDIALTLQNNNKDNDVIIKPGEKICVINKCIV